MINIEGGRKFRTCLFSPTIVNLEHCKATTLMYCANALSREIGKATIMRFNSRVDQAYHGVRNVHVNFAGAVAGQVTGKV